MRVNVVKGDVRFGTLKSDFGTKNKVFNSEWTPILDTYLISSSVKSPKLTGLQKELLLLPDSAVKWANQNRLTPDGTYLIYNPRAYYDSKNKKYVGMYSLANEYQKNAYKHNIKKQNKDSYYTRHIPKGYQIKKVFGFATVVSNDDEKFARQKSKYTLIANSFIGLSVFGVAAFCGHKLLEYVNKVK